MGTATACIPNIGPRERQRRMTFGVAFLVVGLVVGLTLAFVDVARAYRLAAFLPFWMGAIGLLQAREQTCIALVKRRERNMDSGPERVTDSSTLRQLQAQARQVHVKSVAFAAILTAAILAVP